MKSKIQKDPDGAVRILCMRTGNPRPTKKQDNFTDFFDARNRVMVFPEKLCSVDGVKFQPQNKWEKRCGECRRLNRQGTKQLANPEFKGTRELPPGLRFYPSGTGERYPSVTTVLHPDGIDYPKELLDQYAARGTIVHRKIELYLKTGEVFTLKQMWERFADTREHILTLKKGSLKLSHTACNWQGFLAEYAKDFTFDEQEVLLINHEHRFAGRTDVIGTYKGKPAIIDWKTASDYNPDKLKDYFAQLSAYAASCGLDIKYLVVVPFNPKSAKGYEAPLVSTDVKAHFKYFLSKRKAFFDRFGI